MKLQVSKNSFWAKYEGFTTCNAKAIYLVVALVTLFLLGLLGGIGYAFYKDWVTTLAIIGFIAVLFGLGVLVSMLNKPVRSIMVRVFRQKYVKGFFYYGFYVIWKPIQLLAKYILLILNKIGEVVGLWLDKVEDKVQKARISKMTTEKSEIYRAKKMVKQAEGEKRSEMLENFWDTRLENFLTHTGLLALVVGNLFLYFNVPNYLGWWYYPVVWTISVLTSWGLLAMVGYGLVGVFLPVFVKYRNKFEWLDKSCKNTGSIFRDLYHKFCRLIEVTDYQVLGGFSMHRAFSDAQVTSLLEAGEFSVIFSSNVKGQKESGPWVLYFRTENTDIKEKLRQCFPELYYQHNFRKSGDGWTGFVVPGWSKFDDLYEKVQIKSE